MYARTRCFRVASWCHQVKLVTAEEKKETSMDPLTRMLDTIHVGQIAKKAAVSMRRSPIVWKVLHIFLANGMIQGMGLVSGRIWVVFKEKQGGGDTFQRITRVSCPTKRVYISAQHMIPQHSGLGMRIIGTRRGIMSEFDAIKWKLGGEVICECL